jgi:D-lactate dehydrogenase
MRVAAFSIKPYDRESLTAASAGLPLAWEWFEPRLDRETARLAEGARAVNCFVNDTLDAATLERLARLGVGLVTLRCAGFNQVDLGAAAPRPGRDAGTGVFAPRGRRARGGADADARSPAAQGLQPGA